MNLVDYRKEALRVYLQDQNLDNLIKYKKVSNKVKRDLRKIKSASFERRSYV